MGGTLAAFFLALLKPTLPVGSSSVIGLELPIVIDCTFVVFDLIQ